MMHTTVSSFAQHTDKKIPIIMLNNCFDSMKPNCHGAPPELSPILSHFHTPYNPRKPYWAEHDGQWFYMLQIENYDNPQETAATCYNYIKNNNLSVLSICLDGLAETWIQSFHLHILLQNYSFRKYMSPTHPDRAKEFSIKNFNIITNTPIDTSTNTILAESIYWSRDLSNEPSNVCTPTWMAENIEHTLRPLGVEIEILDEAQLKAIGMNALLGVAKGSVQSPKVVIMKHLHGTPGDAPVVLLGKGVCFDSGGISLKPANGMGEMKDDMSGAGVVAASMRTLALTKTPLNVIGIVGLVENMPDANAQKPGDIVTTLSGITVQIVNTDAEGRLVLCDLVWYAQSQYAPRCMVDFATLTGAIRVALGSEYAGLFSNNDALAQDLLQAGIDSGDLLWRMPMCAGYDRLIDSSVADIDNSVEKKDAGAGSATAAHFIARFHNNVPWAHLDIASTAFLNRPTAKSPVAGGSGFGVHLVHRWLTQWAQH